jgi:hypothetical protein
MLAIQSLRLPPPYQGLGSILPYRSRDIGSTDFDGWRAGGAARPPESLIRRISKDQLAAGAFRPVAQALWHAATRYRPSVMEKWLALGERWFTAESDMPNACKLKPEAPKEH